jgi:hypothetical protein
MANDIERVGGFEVVTGLPEIDPLSLQQQRMNSSEGCRYPTLAPLEAGKAYTIVVFRTAQPMTQANWTDFYLAMASNPQVADAIENAKALLVMQTPAEILAGTGLRLHCSAQIRNDALPTEPPTE